MAKVTNRRSEEGMVICSFNCSGLNQSASYISDIIVKHEIDISIVYPGNLAVTIPSGQVKEY